MVGESAIEKTVIGTVVGPLTISGDRDFVHSIEFTGSGAVHDAENNPKHRVASPAVNDAVDQLNRYFSGTLFSFDLPIILSGTDFQQNVWRIMQTIAYGQVLTYGDIALRLGNIRLSRAVGQAANRNPIPIVVPCHRVVGAKGAMVGFAAGVEVKEILLNHERRFAETQI